MTSAGLSAHSSSIGGYFPVLLATFAALVLLSWPIMFSFDLWVLKDRGNLLNVDYLLDHHLRLGVEAYYSYGLLPLALQRLAFATSGKGYWPLLALDVLYVVFTAYFWAWFVSRSSEPRLWLLCAVLWCPILLWVNPNFPYVIVVVSLLTTLRLVYKGSLSAALSTAVIGWFSVPSLPVIVTAAVCALLLVRWWSGDDRRLGALLRAFVPGVATFCGLALVLGLCYGFDSLRATLLPTSGASFYRTIHYGLLTRGSGLDFLAPADATWRYYLANRAGWWIVSSLALLGFACAALYQSLRLRSLTGAAAMVMLCALIHAFFSLFAYGPPSQHVIYDPILAAGTMAGFAWSPLGRWRNALLYPLLALGALNSWGQVHETYNAWRDTHVSANSAGLYASTDFRRDWDEILRLAQQQPVLVLSYGTGVHHYFPSLQSPESWTVQLGQMSAPDIERLLVKINDAQILAEDLTGPTVLFDKSPEIRGAMRPFCLVSITRNFKLYRRTDGSCDDKVNDQTPR